MGNSSTEPGRSGHLITDETGSIPEWVMLLVMAVGIVLAIGAMVGPRLISIIENALSRLS
jgi:hypothetical protein